MAAIASGAVRIVDLSHPLNDSLPPWPGDASSFEVRQETSIEHDGYFTRSFWMREHYGTHVDAPAHFVVGGLTVDAIPTERLCGLAVVLDVSDGAAANSDFAAGPGPVSRWEATHGPVPPGAIVLLRTGWDARWPDAARYATQDSGGTMHFPGFSPECVQILIERNVSAIGVDTMSVDPGCSADFAVHRLALGAGLYHLENLRDLSRLPEKGALLVVAPLNLAGGSGAPCRVLAFVPKC